MNNMECSKSRLVALQVFSLTHKLLCIAQSHSSSKEDRMALKQLKQLKEEVRLA